MPTLTKKVPHHSDKEKSILRELQLRVRFWERKVGGQAEKWREVEDTVLAYMPESEVMRQRKAKRLQGLPDYTTIQIPYSYAALMSAHTYLTSVFLGRNPVMQFSGRHGESQQQTQALEALIDYQMFNGGILPYFYTWLYDALKYGYGTVCNYWDDQVEVLTEVQLVQNIDPVTGLPFGEGEEQEVHTPIRTYSGNKLFCVQPQDFVFDPRFPVKEFQRGEYAGRRMKISWNECYRREKRGYYTNTQYVKQSRGSEYYGIESGSSRLERPSAYSNTGDTEYETSGFNLKHPQFIGCYELVVEIIPEEWSLGRSDWPEKWIFTCTDDFGLLLQACPLGALHFKYPYSVIPLEPEGYGLTTRGLVEVLQPVQNTVDWLLNSHFFNIRAALNNKMLVDPSRVVMKDVLSTLPGGAIRLKPEAYGQDVRTMVQQLQVADVTAPHLQNFQMMVGIGERISGVNDQIMGMLNTGGRKTATEVRTSTSFGINRLKTQAEYASITGVDPLARMMVQNSQQYYDMEMKLRIAGDLSQQAGPGFVTVDPTLIAGFYDFVPVDGTLPIDRFAQVNLWKEIFQSILMVPQIGMQYDLAGIFQWVAQLAGLKNITQFKIQLAPDEQLMLQAQMGNMVPMQPSGGRRRGGRMAGGPSGGSQAGNQLGYSQTNKAMAAPTGAM